MNGKSILTTSTEIRPQGACDPKSHYLFFNLGSFKLLLIDLVYFSYHAHFIWNVM